MDTSQIIEAIDAEIRRLQEAKALLGGSPASKPAAKPSPEPGRRKMSTAGRVRIVAAQKARWAKVNRLGGWHHIWRMDQALARSEPSSPRSTPDSV
jgi:hypothetical protein